MVCSMNLSTFPFPSPHPNSPYRCAFHFLKARAARLLCHQLCRRRGWHVFRLGEPGVNSGHISSRQMRHELRVS